MVQLTEILELALCPTVLSLSASSITSQKETLTPTLRSMAGTHWHTCKPTYWVEHRQNAYLWLLCVLSKAGKKYFSAELTDCQVKNRVTAYTFFTCFFFFYLCVSSL